MNEAATIKHVCKHKIVTDYCEPLKFWLDVSEFDMNPLRLFPDLADEPIVKLAQRKLLYAYSNPSNRSAEPVFAHPTFWNGALGAPYFSYWPNYPRDEHGWVNIHGYATDSSICPINLFDAVRDTWAHTINVTLDCQQWLRTPLSYNRVFYPIMSHICRWSVEPDIGRLKAYARRWLIRMCIRGLRLAGSGTTAQQAIEHAGRPSRLT